MPSVSGHMKKSGVLTGTFQVLTGVPSMFLQHEYLSQIVTSCASSCHLCGSPPATFPVGSAGSRITGLETTVREDRWVHGLCLGGFKISAGQNTSLGRLFLGAAGGPHGPLSLACDLGALPYSGHWTRGEGGLHLGLERPGFNLTSALE